LDHGFTRDQEKGRAFLERTGGWESSKRVQAMQVYLLGALRDASLVGKYSSMHINTIYQYGYNHPRTVKLAYKYVSSTALLENLFIFEKILQSLGCSKNRLEDKTRNSFS
jgi:hypothetical protein